MTGMDMTYPETVRFQGNSLGVDWLELVDLFKVADLGGREGDKVKRAFENSTVVCFAMDGCRCSRFRRLATEVTLKGFRQL
jgi:hypothetical protein